MRIHFSGQHLSLTVYAEAEDDHGCDLHNEDGPVSAPILQYMFNEVSFSLDLAAILREVGSLAALVKHVEAKINEAVQQ